MNIRELSVVLGHYNITPEAYDRIQVIPFFKRALEANIVEWNSALTTHERVKIEAAAILEAAMPKLGARMMRETEGLPAVIEAGKLFAKISGIGEEKINGPSAEKFTITINLGGDEKLRFEKDVTPRTKAGETTPLLAHAEGSGDPEAL